MASATMDHIISLIVFLAAIMVFFGLFSQTNQTAIIYERHKALSAKTSDLLDTLLLNPGIPSDWGKEIDAPTGFGVQDPEFTQYQISSFSLMRLTSETANIVEYDKTTPSIYYNSISSGSGASLLMPQSQALNYSMASTLLGIKSIYGFQLTLTPDITVAVTENRAASPLDLSISASGTGFVFASAPVNYCLISVSLAQSYPTYTIHSGVVTTDQRGVAEVTFSSVTDANQVYAFIAYAHLDGVVGVGYHSRVSSTDQYLVPVIKDAPSQQVALAHSYDLNNSGPQGSSLQYNVTFLIQKENYVLSELLLDSNSTWGTVTSGSGNPYPTLTLPSFMTGILVVTYQTSAAQGGIVMMPWGVSSLAFPVTFGGNPAEQEWVATDIRQVTVGGVAYQAKLGLWNLKGYSVTNS